MLLRYGAMPQMWRWGLALRCATARPTGTAPIRSPISRWPCESLRSLAGDRGRDRHRLRPCRQAGVLKIYRSTGIISTGDSRPMRLLARPACCSSGWTGDDCVATEPALAPVADRLWRRPLLPPDEVGDCNKFTQGLAAILAARGARFRYRTEVKPLEVKAGVVQGAVTASGERIAADAVVVATRLLDALPAPHGRARRADLPGQGRLDDRPRAHPGRARRARLSSTRHASSGWSRSATGSASPARPRSPATTPRPTRPGSGR